MGLVLYWILVLIQIWNNDDGGVDAEVGYTGVQPSFMTRDGHLVLVTGSDKNISLETRGSGYVNINGQNIVLIAKMAVNASETVERLRVTKLVALEQTVESLSAALEGPRGMKRRMSNLEVALNNGTVVIGGGGGGGRRPDVLRLLPLTRRVNALEAAVRDLKALLTSNECASNPCKNGATCEDGYNGFICRCPINWEGVLCERDVNECAQFAGTDLGCQNGARCTNKPGTYECACLTGWFGVHCTQRSNDCGSASSRDLCDHGICVTQSGATGYTCICDQGWKTNGITQMCSTDVDECLSKNHPCSRNPFVSCNNIPGSFYCDSCPPGYTGNGFHCNDIDECATDNGGCSTLVQCTNTQGSRVCGMCPPGYLGNGVTCSQGSGPCVTNNGGCNPFATCSDNPAISSTYVQCTCRPGYVGTGLGSDGCVPGGTLTPLDPCQSNPCQRGSCARTSSGFSCTCPPGYAGTRCERKVNGCQDSPCENGATCTDLDSGRFRCNCTLGYTGPTCGEQKRSCGDIYRAQSGTIRFPSSPSERYGHGKSCAWTIKVNASQVINITFKKFDLEPSPECIYDYLQIHDGSSSGSLMIGRFCGNKAPKNGNFVSTTNSLYFWFRSDTAISHLGFELDWNATAPVCGAEIQTSGHGVLSSPGSPGKYPPNRDCYWSITAPLQKRIQFHFYTVMIANHNNCSGDYLAIHDGVKRNDPIIQKYCSTIHPEPLVTPGAFALVHFHSDAEGSDNGFQLTYSIIEGFPGCGGVMTAAQGDIVSPRDPGSNKYKSAVDCGWRIQQPVNQKIKITFLTFELEESRTCSFDYVTIHEGADERAPLVNRYCGKNLPRDYISNGNVLYIRFRSDWSQEQSGFHIKYISVCGGDYATPEGIITSPNYPEQYPDSRTCIYRIMQPLGKAIKLHFLDFEVEDNSYPACNFDYLQLRDGDNENSTLIGQYCGGQEHTPPDAISTHNYMWLQFNTDSFVRNRGFKANYSTIDSECGGILRDTHGVINSPSHPDMYPHNIRCSWVIVAPPGFIIQLTFITFSLEHHPSCRRDYVEIFDNSSLANTGGLIGRYCSSNKPPVMTSTENIMNIFFVTDSSVTREGFTATYIMMDATKLCGGNFYTTKGTITSPNYPRDYLHEKDCIWVITVPQGQQIMLNVTDFTLEKHMMCNFDYLEIRNGGYKTSPLVGKFCSNEITRLIPSMGNQMYLHFVSDASRSAKGFKLMWDGTATGCGGTLNAPSGSIISPNYPSPYGRNAACHWRIAVSRGSTVQLVIVDLELESHSQCKLDYIEIHEGLELTGKLLGRYCSSHPALVLSKTNHMYIKFRSDISMEGRGFHLKYTTLCTTKITGYRGVIESPNFPASYPGDIQCTWHIAAPPGNKINITFSHFDTEVQPEMTAAKARANPGQKINPCEFDYVQITDSDKETQDPSDHTMGTFCGAVLPPPIWSTESNVFVHFQSDALVAGIGFRLEWVLNGCGGILDANKANGTIMSPGYPINYATSLSCEWIITTAFDQSVRLNISDLNMERTKEDCNFDSVQVYSGEDATGLLLGKYCHSNTNPVVMTTTGNTMFVKFVSDYSLSGRGFNATYSSVASVCGGLIAAPKGIVHSRNYPNNYDAYDDCTWIIEVDENHVIVLQFQEFDVEFHGNCSMDYLRLYDGDSMTATKMLDHCGSDLPTPNRFVSTTNKLLLHFKSDGSVASKGFKANFTISCGARIVTEDTGLLNLQDSINVDNQNSNCSWVIVGKRPEDRVTLTVTHMDVSSSDDAEDCDNYYLEVLDGESLDSPRMGGKYCSNKAPPHITSSGNTMVVHLVSVGFGRHYGLFSASYSVLSSACGGNLTSEHGAIATPNYPSRYPLNAECVWEIAASPGNRAQLSFSTFNIATSEGCNADYVEVREEGALGKLIGVYCGDMPANLTVANRLWIKFRSGSEGETGTGFIAEYTLLHGNEALSGPSGKIANPLYPRPYIQTGEYTWRITVQFGYAIAITFSEFYVDARKPMCTNAHLAVYDGFDKSAPELMKTCGPTLPDAVTSSSNVVFVHLVTDPRRAGTIFMLDWLQVDKNKPTFVKSDNSTSCGGMVDMKHKDGAPDRYELKSPGYPGGYAGRLNCEWIFETTPGFHLQLNLYEVDLESNAACSFDYVQILRGRRNLPEWRPMQTLCLSNSSKIGPIHAHSTLMKVIFHTDAYVNKTGFTGHVLSVCGGLLKDPDGVIEVSNATQAPLASDTPWRFMTRTDCQWNITVRSGRRIFLKFTRLDLRNVSTESSCSEEYVIMKNGGAADSPLLGAGKYCGNTLPDIPETSSNRAYIRFKSDMSSQRGFRLEYREVGNACGGSTILSATKNMTEIFINSPNFPNIPPPHTECMWTIMAPAGERIKMTFVDRFDLTKSKDCSIAAVEVRDGGTQTSSLIGAYCTTMPGSLETTGNVLYVRFFTDVDDPKNGFRANIGLSRCGGSVRDKVGFITSPGSPMGYPANIDCEWRIISLPGHTISLDLQKIDFPRGIGNNCTDYVALFEPVRGNATGETLLGKYCNVTKAFVRTSDNEAIVRFHSGSQTSSNNPFKRTTQTGFKLAYNASLDSCGGQLSTPSGSFQSPGYPNSVTSSRGCEWIITVPQGRRITLTFLDFDIMPPMQFARPSGVIFYNDEEGRSRIAAFNGSSVPHAVKSTSNVMNVLMWFARSTGHRGFKASYTSDEPAVCGGYFENSTAGIILPPDASLNLTAFACLWESIRPVQINETMVLTVEKANLGTRDVSRCQIAQSKLVVYTDDFKKPLTELCGNYTEPYIVRSPYPVTKLMALEGPYHGNVDFLLRYSVSPCGGVLADGDNVITSPGFPGNYPGSMDCAWVGTYSMETAHWYRINFTHMDIEESGNCEKDYLIIRNGGLPTSPQLGRFCGKKLPSDMQTQNNMIWVDFHSDAANQGGGFSVNLIPVSAGCGGIYHRNKGQVRTPSYPKPYASNTECEWEVRVEPGYTITLTFIERFYLEQSPGCIKDFAEVFDYVDDDWKSMGRVCGRMVTSASSFNSTHERMKLLFRSDGAINGDGFKAAWNVKCGGVIEGMSKGIIVSPNYPQSYENNLFCNYTILAPNNHISVTFETFSLESTVKECNFDNVTLYGFANAWSRTLSALGTYCGTDTPPQRLFRNQLSLVFMTDDSVVRKGFLMRYEITTCGGTIDSPKALYSPRSGSGYLGNLNCTWIITAPDNQAVILKFSRLELEHSFKCHYDSVTVYDGASIDTNQTLGTFCGNLSSDPPLIKSKTNQMIVVLSVAHQRQAYIFEGAVGFTLSEKGGCGGTLSLTDVVTTFSSPDTDRDGKYDAFLDCHWLLMAPVGRTVSFTFTKLEMASCSLPNATQLNVTRANCSCDFVEVRDGDSQAADLIGVFCGALLLAPLISSSNNMWIRLVTDDADNAAGFIAQAVTMPSLCGPLMLNVTNSSQTLQSPNYPDNYPNNIRCRWLLTNIGNVRFDIKLVDLDVDSSEGCAQDSLTITDVGVRTGPMWLSPYSPSRRGGMRFPIISQGTGRGVVINGRPDRPASVFRGSRHPIAPSMFCGKLKPFDYYSESNNLAIAFTSDPERSAKGFKLTYQITGCTRNYTGPQGRIFVERLPNHCYIVVTAPVNTTIALYFASFQIFSAIDCKSKALEIRDGENDNAPALAKYCGYELPKPVFSTGNKLYLHSWRSDGSDYEHFDITYTTTDKGRGCGGQLFNYGGVFTSPFYPDNVRNFTVCRWDVTVPTGTVPVLKFQVFDIGARATCDSDFVEMIDVDTNTGVEIVQRKYCGEDNPAMFTGQFGTVAVRYTTSVHNGGTGWIMKFVGKLPGSSITNI